MNYEERHPTDSDGNYLRAGDDKLRVDRGGMMLVNDRMIAWLKVGDEVNTPIGRGRIAQVNCMACMYLVDVDGRRVPVEFEAVA